MVDQEAKLDHFAKSMGVIAFSSSLNFESVERRVVWVEECVEEVARGVLKLENEVFERCGMEEENVEEFREEVMGNEEWCGVVVSFGGEKEWLKRLDQI